MLVEDDLSDCIGWAGEPAAADAWGRCWAALVGHSVGAMAVVNQVVNADGDGDTGTDVGAEPQAVAAAKPEANLEVSEVHLATLSCERCAGSRTW